MYDIDGEEIPELYERITELEKEVEKHKETISTLLRRLNKAEPEVLDLRFEVAGLRTALERIRDFRSTRNYVDDYWDMVKIAEQALESTP